MFQGDLAGQWSVKCQAQRHWSSGRHQHQQVIRTYCFYKVDYRQQDKDRWTSGTYTSLEAAIVSDLKPETRYRFRVSATNRFCTGHYSWASVETETKSKEALPITSDEFFDVAKLRAVQVTTPPTPPPETEPPTQEEIKPVIQTANPDSVYNIGDLLYKGKFYEERRLTLPSDGDKPFILRTVPQKSGLREFELLNSIRHERLVNLHAAFSAGEFIHLVLEHTEGEHIAHHLSQSRKYTEDDVASVIRQVLYGLEFLQRSNIVHLNLQPASIVVSKREGCEIKLTDFSLARKLSGPVGEVFPRQGYPDFIPPEVIVQDLAGFSADVWGIGAITFLLLSGVLTFHGDSTESTLVNIALNRYDAADLYENVTTEALKFLYKVLKRIPSNRLTLQECLDHKWLQLTDKYSKERENTIFLTNKLATFVQEYDTTRQGDSFTQNFESLVLPIQMSRRILS